MRYHANKIISAIGMSILATAFFPTGSWGQTSFPIGQDEEISAGVMIPDDFDAYGEALLRGPVHEAFAEQYNQYPVEGVIVDRAPPPLINEIPPDIRPEGDNIQWLSGYWFWDDERADFLWISGTWRVIPPGQRWLPGYWAEIGDRYQWVPGAWVATELEAIEYIAQAPPESLDLGPVGVAPSDNHFWIPGSWIWMQNDYAWRPGYWTIGYSDWVWVPQRYLWTPRGYVFYDGYWDYPLARRGTLFAPFFFRQPVFARRDFFFSPRVSILASLLQSHFWVRPGFHHYYFGDFYAANYRNIGIIPWHSFHRGFGFQSHRFGFDPLFAHASLVNRPFGGNFYQQINNQYNVFVNHVDMRPPVTFLEQQQRFFPGYGRGGFHDNRPIRGFDVDNLNEIMLGESIHELAQREPNRFTRLTPDQLTRVRDEAEAVPNLASLRREVETRDPENRARLRDREAGERGPQGMNRPSFTRGGEESDRQGRPPRSPDSDGDLSSPIVDRLPLPPAGNGRSRGERSQNLADRPAAQPQRPRSDGTYSAARPPLDPAESEQPAMERPANGRGGNGRGWEMARPDSDQPANGRRSFERVGRGRTDIESPGAEQPSPEQTGIEQSGAEQPQTGRPGIGRPLERPGSEQPGSERPGIERPGIERPGIERLGLEQREIDRPGAEPLGTGRPGMERLGIERSGNNGRPGIEQPRIERPGIERLGLEQREIDRPGAEPLGTGRPGMERLGIERSGNARPGIERPGIERPGIERPGIERPGIERSGLEQQRGIDRPGAEPLGTGRPGMERLGIERSGNGRPGIERPGIERSGLEQQRGIERQGGEPLGIGRPGMERLGIERSGNARPGIEQPRNGRPGIERSGIERPGVDQLRNPRPGVDRSTPERAGIGRQTFERAPVERPNVNRPGLVRPESEQRNLGQPVIPRSGQGQPLGNPMGRGDRTYGIQPTPNPNAMNRVVPNARPSQTNPGYGGPPTSLVPAVRPERSARPEPTMRVPSGSMAPASRQSSGGVAGMNRQIDRGARPRTVPQMDRSPARSAIAPQLDRGGSRPQYAPRGGGESRPQMGPNMRGNRGGGEGGGRGPGGNNRGRGN
jgi:hypothetical protein